MKWKPVRFIGHKIGPFDHIELNWEKGSRYTLIVAENGMGKTTLVAAMAACLSFGDDNLFPSVYFERFASNREALAYLEIELGSETGWILYWVSQPLKGTLDVTDWTPLDTLPVKPNSAYPYPMLSLSNIRVYPSSSINPAPIKLPHLPPLEEAIFIDSAPEGSISIVVHVACSRNLLPLIETWQTAQNIDRLAAAYGVGRDLQRPKIREHQELDTNPLKDILNPFAPIQSSEIFQWIANQYVYYALALSESKQDEAQAYLAAIQRVERLLSGGLEYPITFQVKRNPFRLEVKQNGVVLSVDQLSDGTRSFLSWPLDYLMRASRVNWANPANGVLAPGLILVDEIDAHLHPEWQRRVMGVISQLLPETYVIATTHSPFVLGATDDAQIFRIDKDEDGQLSVKASFDELYGYPADLVLEKAFVPSLYAPEVEQKLLRLTELAGKAVTGAISPQEKHEHDNLLRELADTSPWLNSLLTLSQTRNPSQ